MKIKTFTVNPFRMNCYVYYCEETKEGAIIDPGMFETYEEKVFLDFVNKTGIKITKVLLTHGHIDHVLGNSFAAEVFGVRSCMHAEDKFLYDNAEQQGYMFGLGVKKLPDTETFSGEGQKFAVGNNVLKVLHTPGHSPGGICLIDEAEKVIFPGDVIFRSSIGRTDLAGGDYNTLIHSIKKKLFACCSDEYNIYPGHMEPTTVGHERKFNPFLAD